MENRRLTFLLAGVAVALTLALGGATQFARGEYNWSPPDKPFPGGNVFPPIDTSSGGQEKKGALTIGQTLSLNALSALKLEKSGYIFVSGNNNMFMLSDILGNAQLTSLKNLTLYSTGGEVIMKAAGGVNMKDVRGAGLILPSDNKVGNYDGVSGSVVFDTKDKVIKFFDGSSWKAVGVGTGGDFSYPLILPGGSAEEAVGGFDFTIGKNEWTGFNLTGSNRRIILGVDEGADADAARRSVLSVEDTTQWNHRFDLFADGGAFFGGYVGVGITPEYNLDVAGTGRFSKPLIVGTPTEGKHAATRNYVDSVALELGKRGSGLWIGNINGIYYRGNGNVGIGTKAPNDRLHVAGGNIRVDGNINIVGADNPSNWWYAAGGLVQPVEGATIPHDFKLTDITVEQIKGFWGETAYSKRMSCDAGIEFRDCSSPSGYISEDNTDASIKYDLYVNVFQSVEYKGDGDPDTDDCPLPPNGLEPEKCTYAPYMQEFKREPVRNIYYYYDMTEVVTGKYYAAILLDAFGEDVYKNRLACDTSEVNEDCHDIYATGVTVSSPNTAYDIFVEASGCTWTSATSYSCKYVYYANKYALKSIAESDIGSGSLTSNLIKTKTLKLEGESGLTGSFVAEKNLQVYGLNSPTIECSASNRGEVRSSQDKLCHCSSSGWRCF